jgi:hypothetical protein
MLYPLSYEGLRCMFAQHGGRVLVRRARAGCLVPDGLCRTCAACREPADPPPSRHAAPIVRRVVRAKSRRPVEQRGNGGGWCWLWVTFVGSMGCELVALLLGKIANDEKLDCS